MSFKINYFTHIKCTVIAGLMGIILRDYMNTVVQSFIMENFFLFDGPFPVIVFYLCIVLFMVPISIIHEFIHGTVYRLFGGKVKYGFKGIYAYTQEISGRPLSKLQFFIVLVSPVVLISSLGTIIGGWIGGMIFILNFLGSAGDIYMAAVLLRYKNGCKIIDRSYGFDII